MTFFNAKETASQIQTPMCMPFNSTLKLAPNLNFNNCMMLAYGAIAKKSKDVISES